ncbi:DUF2254 domain-containing protein [Streptomyces sp. NBC_00038]|uniref:DUF2254 domain-containing protein n=1 Tax=Streptomyces sp. NBC_00038 TaxID=2903615 RepID=UPI002252A479|nr:DUF2254 domain-containing protein [Streptomyces sp. NBC_00038]MCX5559765.1 DUF2254 domain-containing protein [Streptomyces sp. NBC_00038]
MTQPVRARLPHRSSGSQRARRTRSHGTALFLVAAGALLGWALPALEEHLPAAGLNFDASTAQATLAAIAGGMITLAGFVVTAITLVIQTVQAMSPRLVAALGHFSRYLVLFGLLIGTALYALVALSHVRGDSVPKLSVTVAIGLVLVDAVAVLYLLASLRGAVTGGGLARAVGDRLRTVIEEMHPPAATAFTTSCRHRHEHEVPLVHRGGPAVIFSLDEPRLTRLAARHDVHIHLVCSVGEFVGSGTVVGHLEARTAGPADPRLARRVAACVRYGPSRTVEQDPAYGFRLLADIAVRALSPAVNDPTTAVQALDQIEDGLLRLAGRPLGPTWLLDGSGRPRISCPAPHWADFVSLALDETLLYGSPNPQIVRRLRALLDHLLVAAPEDRREPLVERREALQRLSATALSDPLLSRVASEPDRQGLGGPPAPSTVAD